MQSVSNNSLSDISNSDLFDEGLVEPDMKEARAFLVEETMKRRGRKKVDPVGKNKNKKEIAAKVTMKRKSKAVRC